MILNENKRVEFRKRRFRNDIKHIVMYVTVPVRAMVGYFEVRKISEMSIHELWHKYGSIGGINKEDFNSYYDSCDKGVAIEVGKVIEFEHPVPLSDLTFGLFPPQSFIYLTLNKFHAIKKIAHNKKDNSIKRIA